MRSRLWLLPLLICSALACHPDPDAQPKLAGFVVLPTNSDQCSQVTFSFMISNPTTQTLYSQQPYSGDSYNVYQSFTSLGFRSLPGRFMAGVSLNGGMDGYPFRWGFSGPLVPGDSITIGGYVAFAEAGKYFVTATLLDGNSPVTPPDIHKAMIAIAPCEQPQSPEPPPPPSPTYQPQAYPPLIPYIANGYFMVPTLPSLYGVGLSTFNIGGNIVLQGPGMQMVLYPGGPSALLNGVPVNLPMPSYQYGPFTYVPIRFYSPFYGGSTVFWDPYTHTIIFDSPY